MALGQIIICMGIVMASFILMEVVAWFSHKYIMHGLLWRWHKSHHTLHNHTFEKNDLFAAIFSLPSVALFYYFTLVHYNAYLIALAFGIFCYGLFYVIFHDIIVHQRIPWRLKSRNRYLQRLVHAHYVHHSKRSKDGCEAFGFLFAPSKYAPKRFTFRRKRSDTQ